MENPIHEFKDLFEQLGLPGDKASITSFIDSHRPLSHDVKLAEAPFWSDSQASFLREELLEDADWAEIVDRLDVALRAS
ncbi:MAG: DUF2789 domain-containing protein [Betaproteobacteria bacterium HGW-Betaproteobacteria-13]|jgi:hypothetical protein|uniref:DUF2789 domain-containing protein n=1 Tax=Parazoarcus communis TaxID=41977 RepID=A0A2U8H3P5_9RHOO|nr:DUF2789 domain-containing protein [Parazoarcus communis]AWI80160.1 hypothetical protein CEW87_12745 [Parazoarcus communis]PKO80973.1 MAG: DUF2789 domain-containing protein [Betaproteobacteria bacterium HGW-Betaproteobacteria-13]